MTAVAERKPRHTHTPDCSTPLWRAYSAGLRRNHVGVSGRRRRRVGGNDSQATGWQARACPRAVRSSPRRRRSGACRATLRRAAGGRAGSTRRDRGMGSPARRGVAQGGTDPSARTRGSRRRRERSRSRRGARRKSAREDEPQRTIACRDRRPSCRAQPADVRDVLWMYSAPELFDLLVRRRGWTVRKYAEFATAAMVNSVALIQTSGITLRRVGERSGSSRSEW